MVHPAHVVFVLVCTFQVSDERSFEKPLALRQLEENRKSLISGRVEWTAESLRGTPFVKHYVSRYARNGDKIVEHRRNDDGWVTFDPSGAGVSSFPKLVLEKRDEMWQSTDLVPEAKVWRGELPVPEDVREQFENTLDVRAVGLQPVSDSVRNGIASLWGGPRFEGFMWTEVRQGATYVVTGERDELRMTWHIDSERGWNPTQITYERDGQVVADARCELMQFGEAWLPNVVEYSIGGRPVETIRVLVASFNQPHDSASFGPVDIGIEPGYSISDFDKRQAENWDGEKQVSAQEYAELERAGRVQPGKTVLWRRKRYQSGERHPYQTDAQYVAWMAARRNFEVSRIGRHVSAWEKYVRDFIQRFSLNDEQQQVAMNLLKDCQQQAEPLLRRTEHPYQKLLIELDEAVTKQNQQSVEQLQAKIEALKAPFEQIFEQRLKPGLDRIPTRGQRRTVAEQTAEAREIEGP